MNLVVKRIASLIIKQWRGELNFEETIELEQWANQSEANRELLQQLTNDETLRQELVLYVEAEEDKESIWKKIDDATSETTQVIPMPVQPHRKYRYMAAAVSIAAVLTTVAYFWFQNKTKPSNTPIAQTTTNDVLPGGNKAILKLSDGKTIVLDNANNGLLAQQGNANIIKQNDGELIYNREAGASDQPFTIDHSPLTYNTLATPAGGHFQLKLPDGTRVWLNAASSITYPTVFTGNERRVTINGEGYFEVAKDATKPFKVFISPPPGGTGGAEVEVLGTHFNINAYDDEAAIRTTLLEGKVKMVNEKKQTAILKPGQQAVVTKDANTINVENKPDAASSISWVKGVFHFEKANLGYVMRQLARWYDVKVVYEGAMSAQTITGDVENNIKLSELLDVLEKMGKAKYTIQGKTVKVIP